MAKFNIEPDDALIYAMAILISCIGAGIVLTVIAHM